MDLRESSLTIFHYRVLFGHHAMLPNATQLYKMYQIWKAAVDTVADVDGLIPTFVTNVAPASAASVALNNGVGNVWGLTDSQPYVWWQVSTAWNLAQDDLRMEAWSKHLVEYLHSLNKDLGLSSEFVYMGDAGEWQDPFAGFAEGNVEKMKSIRAKYDVGGVFSRLNWGGFKLGP